MSTEPDAREGKTGPALLFGCGEGGPPEQWSTFVSYFAQRGDPCYATPLPPSSTAAWLPLSGPANGQALPATPWSGGPPPFLIAAARLSQAALSVHPRLPLAALALLQPPLSLLPHLIGAAGLPLWIAIGGVRPLHVRLWRAAAPSHFHLHPFQGMTTALPGCPGWERIAHALRLWREMRNV